MIIKGLSGLLYSLFKPIMKAIESVIQLALRPITNAIGNALSNKLLTPLKALDRVPSIPFDIMQLDFLSDRFPANPGCAFFQEAVRRR